MSSSTSTPPPSAVGHRRRIQYGEGDVVNTPSRSVSQPGALSRRDQRTAPGGHPRAHDFRCVHQRAASRPSSSAPSRPTAAPSTASAWPAASMRCGWRSSALGLQPGDEVIVPAMTFVATFEAVSQAGGKPVPVDVSAADRCLDPAAVEAAIGPRTRAIMPVDLYGRMADMTALTALATAHDLIVVEDACQAHGSHRDGARAGTLGNAAAFSFYPGKNLGAMGDAGALVTDDSDLAATGPFTTRARAATEVRARCHRLDRPTRRDPGGGSPAEAPASRRLECSAPSCGGPLRRRPRRRRGPAAAGRRDRGQVWHLYVVRTQDPAGLAAHLADRGIGTGRHYPEPPHLSKAYAPSGSERILPRRRTARREVISLPIFPGIAAEQVGQASRASGRGSRMAEAPANDAPTACSRTSSSATASSSSPSPTSTAAGSATTAGSGRSSKFSEVRRSARTARSRAIVHLRRSDDRGRRLRRSWGHVHQRQIPARHLPGRGAANRAKTGRCSLRWSNAGRRSAREPPFSADCGSVRAHSSARGRS